MIIDYEDDGVIRWERNGEKKHAELIDLIEAYEAEPIKHGRWITVSDGYGNGVATASICECSLCKDTIWVYKNDKRKWNYCPNCGARMDDDWEEPEINPAEVAKIMTAKAGAFQKVGAEREWTRWKNDS